MNEERFKYLFNQYFQRTASEEEKAELFQYGGLSEYDATLHQLIQDTWNKTIPDYQQGEEIADKIFNRILQGKEMEVDTPVVSMNRRPWARVAAASAIFILLGVGILSLVGVFNKKETEFISLLPDNQKFKNDIAAPTKQKATITLADGTTVALDSLTSGILATQENVSVSKTRDGRIKYDGSGYLNLGLVYNTLSNPRGSQVVDLTLADGSRVWLNAGSSVTYPVAFVGNERKVSITGETYFEVAHDASKPFYVRKADVSILVLGTHFNVNAYNDEADIKITLLEGSVKVLNAQSSLIIKPNQQAIVTNKDVLLNMKVDVEQVMAWKNGYFNFNNADIKKLMREIARWYAVEVVYEGAVPKQLFGGEMPRNSNLSQVLEILKTSGVKFTIDGRKLKIEQ